MWSETTNQQKHCDYVILANEHNEHKTNDLQDKGPSNVNLFVSDSYPLATYLRVLGERRLGTGVD